MSNRRWIVLALALTAVLLQGCSGSSEPAKQVTATDEPSTTPQRGGEAIVLLDVAFAGFWPSGLDPANNPSGGANISLMSSIFGGLFRLVANDDGSGARIEGDLAEGYEIREGGRQIAIRLREGLTFSDGTPVDSAAVKFNIERALTSSCTCAPTRWPWVKEQPVTTPDERTIIVHFTRPYGPFINAIPASNLNWIVSPGALKTMGEAAFRMKPVGAGPFEVVSNTLSSELVLKRNERYWRKDRPYLDRLTFRSISGDQAAYQALLAGDAQAYEGMASPLLQAEAAKNGKLLVTQQPSTSPGVIQLNTRVPPFNDQRAREAIYYATNVEALSIGVFQGRFATSQSFTTPAGLFHREKVDGYRKYDLGKAKAIVQQLGGLKVRLGTLRNLVAEQMVTALQTQWRAAGIDTEVEMYDLGTLINRFSSGQWQSMLQYVGSYDPDVGSGLGARFGSNRPLSGTSDPKLDELMAAAVATMDAGERAAVYGTIAQYLSDKAYAPFLVAPSAAQLTRGLRGPGLTTPIPPLLVNTSVQWQDVWRSAD